MKALSTKKLHKLKKEGKLRDKIELWVDCHNHKLELIRTINGFIGITLSFIILLKVFGFL